MNIGTSLSKKRRFLPSDTFAADSNKKLFTFRNDCWIPGIVVTEFSNHENGDHENAQKLYVLQKSW